MTQRLKVDSGIESAVAFGAIRRILIVQFRPYGDVLLTTGYLSALKKRFSEASIDFLVQHPFQDVLYRNPFINKVITTPKRKGVWSYMHQRLRLFWKVRRQRYDLVIDQQNGTGSGQVCVFSGARWKLGWEDSPTVRFYNLAAKRGERRYSASAKFDLLAPLGIEPQTYSLFYHIREESEQMCRDWLREHGLEPGRFLLISPGSSDWRKQWHVPGWVDLTRRMVTKMPVVLLWAPNELEVARQVQQAVPETILAPPTTFNQGAAFVKQTRLLICNDGGLNHLSVATGTPAVALFGFTSPRNWSPQGEFPHHRHVHNPGWSWDAGCSFGITANQVDETVVQVLEEPEMGQRQ